MQTLRIFNVGQSEITQRYTNYWYCWPNVYCYAKQTRANYT